METAPKLRNSNRAIAPKRVIAVGIDRLARRSDLPLKRPVGPLNVQPETLPLAKWPTDSRIAHRAQLVVTAEAMASMHRAAVELEAEVGAADAGRMLRSSTTLSFWVVSTTAWDFTVLPIMGPIKPMSVCWHRKSETSCRRRSSAAATAT